MDAWSATHLIEPAARALASVPVGGEVTDQALLDLMATGVEGLFRAEIRHQYAWWAPESSTDGSVPYVCWRAAADVLQLVGLTHLDFTSYVMPFRAEIRPGRPTTRATVTVFVGQVDRDTGRPPRLPAGTIIVAVRSGRRVTSAELITRRRQEPIAWTRAIVWDGPPAAL